MSVDLLCRPVLISHTLESCSSGSANTAPLDLVSLCAELRFVFLFADPLTPICFLLCFLLCCRLPLAGFLYFPLLLLVFVALCAMLLVLLLGS